MQRTYCEAMADKGKAMTKIATLGPEGTFSQGALLQYDNDCESALYPSIPLLFEALARGDVSQIFCPIENSFGGDVTSTIDELVQHNFYINKEITAKISQNLFAKTSLELSQIKQVFSHQQALSQCTEFLKAQLTNAQIIATSSTAGSAENLGEFDACIGSFILKDKYALQIIKQNIEDDPENRTKFALISKEKTSSGEKTSIAFSTDNKPGELYKILSIFNDFQVNMLKIASRPFKNGNWEYIFFVDISGGDADDNVSKCLEKVEEASTFFKNLGSY